MQNFVMVDGPDKDKPVAGNNQSGRQKDQQGAAIHYDLLEFGPLSHYQDQKNEE
jgi:hypothetical protein